MNEIFFITGLIFIVECASKAKTFSIVSAILIEDRDGRGQRYDRKLVEAKAVWCASDNKYEKVEVKRLHNQSSLIKEHAND